ncbi:MAG: hypothetical protein R2731_19505 [Nocardioides sp.]
MLVPLEVVALRRPVALVALGAVVVTTTFTGAPPPVASYPTPHPAPFAAAVAELTPDTGRGVLTVQLSTESGLRLRAAFDLTRRRCWLEVADPSGAVTRHRSRRFGRTPELPQAAAVTLTGSQLTAWTARDGEWTARARVSLRGRVDVHDPALTAALQSGYRWSGDADCPVARLTAGGFGQLGLRDLRFVTGADGTPLVEGGNLLLTASSSGPGFFDTGHTSVWTLTPDSLDLAHTADIFVRRSGGAGVYGDHGSHLLRDGDRWLFATSTWGDVDRVRPDTRVTTVLAETTADLTRGRHVVEAGPLVLPTEGLASVGTWDPHLVRRDGEWHVGYVSARKYFSFHPALAQGRTLDQLALVGADRSRTATEGPTLVDVDGQLVLLASDGRDGPRGRRARYPVFDLTMTERGELTAPYPTNIPWPTLAHTPEGWLMVTFDGTAYGGDLVGYGTHGNVVLMRESRA